MATATRPIFAVVARPALRRPKAVEDVAAVAGAVLCMIVLLAALVVLAAFMAEFAAGALTEATLRLAAATTP